MILDFLPEICYDFTRNQIRTEAMKMEFPTIDMTATGQNIIRLRKARGLSVRDVQQYFGFEEPQAVYKWQQGKALPTVDNLYALGALLGVPMDSILVPQRQLNLIKNEQQGQPCCSYFLHRCGVLTYFGKRALFREIPQPGSL